MNGIFFDFLYAYSSSNRAAGTALRARRHSSPLVNALPVGTQPNAPLLVPINVESPEEIAAAGYLRALSIGRVKMNKVKEGHQRAKDFGRQQGLHSSLWKLSACWGRDCLLLVWRGPNIWLEFLGAIGIELTIPCCACLPDSSLLESTYNWSSFQFQPIFPPLHRNKAHPSHWNVSK